MHAFMGVVMMLSQWNSPPQLIKVCVLVVALLLLGCGDDVAIQGVLNDVVDATTDASDVTTDGAAGGAVTGGSMTGGAATGGSVTGGMPSGGAMMGGTPRGGTPRGGPMVGGASTGGPGMVAWVRGFGEGDGECEDGNCVS